MRFFTFTTLVACASVSYAGPINVAPSADVSLAVNPEHSADLLGLAPTKRQTGQSPPRLHVMANGHTLTVIAKQVKRSTITTNDQDPFINSRRQYLVHVTNPADGSDLGLVSSPGAGSEGNDDDDLITFNPGTGRARQFSFGPGHQEGQTFEISPAENDGVFGRRGGLLAAVGRGKPANLAPGSPNFANLGLARELPGGLLNLNLPLDLDLPSRLLGLTHGTPLTGVTDGAMDPASESGPGGLALGILDGPLDMVPGEGGDAVLGPIKKLLAHPEDMNEKGAPQSAIWTLDPATKRLNARYVNSNGDAVPTQFVTGGACEHLICLTADVAVFRDAWGEDATEIHLSAGIL